MKLSTPFWRAGAQAMFLFLLLFGLLRSLGSDYTPRIGVLCALVAVVFFSRRALPTLVWLTLLCTLWLGLLVHAQDFMWLEFPLVFVFLAALPRWPGVAAAAALWAVAAFAPLRFHPESWTVAAAIGPFIGTVFAVGVFHAYRHLQEEAAHHAQVAAQLRETQAELATREHQAGRLEERERLSREIHDTVAQGLSSIVLVSRAARGSDDPARVQEHLALIESTASENLTEARRFVRELAAGPEGLPEALGRVVDGANRRAQALSLPTRCELVCSGDTTRAVPPQLAEVVQRAAQEGVNNALKHSGAQRVVVTLGVFADAVTLDVVDNGRASPGGRGGHSVKDVPGAQAGEDGKGEPHRWGYGLRGLAKRVGAAGGELTVETGQGTALAVRLPIKEEPVDA